MKTLSPKQNALLKDPALTKFQRTVLEALCLVPEGNVTTYKHLATAISCGSNQAVGQALRHNPFAPVIPCHRVVSSDRSIGGFGGTIKGDLIKKKVALLKDEGVRFSDDGKVDPSCIYTF